LFHFNYAGYE